jgi:SAM-dependent methyltransferase
MRAQRPPGSAPVIAGRAESLPFDEDAVDAAMASITIHHWEPPEAGLAEMRRVARDRVVIFTFDMPALPEWQLDYLAEGIEFEAPRFPTIDAVAAALGGRITVESIPTPADCVDGFFEAYWNRPEKLLDPEVRASQSFWAIVPDGAEERMISRLAADLESGAWDEAHGALREQSEFVGAMRLVISEP